MVNHMFELNKPFLKLSREPYNSLIQIKKQLLDNLIYSSKKYLKIKNVTNY